MALPSSEHFRHLAQEGDVITAAIWGADVAPFYEGLNPVGKVLHYRSIPKDILAKAKTKMSALDIYLKTGGAIVADHQPYNQIVADGLLNEPCNFVPMADIITHLLAGKDLVRQSVAHNPVMLQTLGLLSDKAEQVYQTLCGMPLHSLRPNELYVVGQILTARNEEELTERHVVLCTHDSVMSRMVGFAQCPVVVWTGTHIGIAVRNDDCQPSQETFEADICFEGSKAVSRAAITNVAMLGHVYKELLRQWGYDYKMVGESLLILSSKVRPFNLKDMPLDMQDPQPSIRWLLAEYSSLEKAAVALIKTAAFACHLQIKKTANVLKIPRIKKIAVTGGWARNPLFMQELSKIYEIKETPSSGDATHIGLAAAALIEVEDVKTYEEAFAMLSECCSNDC